MSNIDQTARPSIMDRLRDAALERDQQRQDEHRRVSNIVLGEKRNTRRSVTEVINLGGDYLVQVADHDDNTESWTFVVGGKTSNWFHGRQEDAVLHLIASRYDDNPNSNVSAAFYAGRVLGLPSIAD
jgi:hypothetical protein